MEGEGPGIKGGEIGVRQKILQPTYIRGGQARTLGATGDHGPERQPLTSLGTRLIFGLPIGDPAPARQLTASLATIRRALASAQAEIELID
jgi:hypothetical protein